MILSVSHNKNKSSIRKNPSKYATVNHGGIQSYWILCKKTGMPKVKYGSHSSENFLLTKSYGSTKKELCGGLGNRGAADKQFHKSENKLQ